MSDDTIIRFVLFGARGSIDEARVAAIPVLGDIFEGYTNDYVGDYWLGHWHIPPGESKWHGVKVEICANIHMDEDGTELKESDHPTGPPCST